MFKSHHSLFVWVLLIRCMHLKWCKQFLMTKNNINFFQENISNVQYICYDHFSLIYKVKVDFFSFFIHIKISIETKYFLTLKIFKTFLMIKSIEIIHFNWQVLKYTLLLNFCCRGRFQPYWQTKYFAKLFRLLLQNCAIKIFHKLIFY